MGGGASNFASGNTSTTDYTTTNTSNIANSFNQTLSNVQDYSNIGNVSVGDTSGSSPTTIALVMGGLALLFGIVFIFRK